VTGYEEELEEMAFDDAAMAKAMEDLMEELTDDEKAQAEAEAKDFLDRTTDRKAKHDHGADRPVGQVSEPQAKGITAAGDDNDDDGRNMYNARI
jgi:hypothetical protein